MNHRFLLTHSPFGLAEPGPDRHPIPRTELRHVADHVATHASGDAETLGRLAGQLRDELEVLVEMENGASIQLRGSRDQQIRN